VRDDPFEKAARAVEQALRGVEARVAQTRILFEQSAHRRAGRSARHGDWLAVQIEESWGRIDAEWVRRGRRRRPRTDRGEGGAEPEPAPVRPLNPSTLSGGAEATVDS
jgi:hypothetical protein